MPFPIMAAIALGGAVSSAIASHKKKNGTQGKVRNVNDFYRNQKPVGYLTNEDYGFVERGRERGARAIGTLGQQQRGATIARQVSRGLGYSPATEYLQRDADQREAGQLTDLNRGAEDTLYRIRGGRESFEQTRLMAAWSGELGAIQSDYAGEQAQRASFWNSMLPLARTASSYFGGGGQAGGGGMSPTDQWGQFDQTSQGN